MRRVLVAGSRGTLGSLVLAGLGDRAVGLDLPDLDITCEESVVRAVKSHKPDLIVNAAAVTDVDRCELEPELARRVHRLGVKHLCDTGARVITVSTDHVFTDGRGVPLTESSPVEPVNEYAAGKLLGETEALRVKGNCVVRTSWLFGEKGLLPWIVRTLSSGGEIRAVADQTSSLTSASDLADALVSLVLDEEADGLYHCVNFGAGTPFSLACLVMTRLNRGSVVPVRWKDLRLPAPRPLWSVLETERGIVMPSLEEAVESCMQKML